MAKQPARPDDDLPAEPQTQNNPPPPRTPQPEPVRIIEVSNNQILYDGEYGPKRKTYGKCEGVKPGFWIVRGAGELVQDGQVNRKTLKWEGPSRTLAEVKGIVAPEIKREMVTRTVLSVSMPIPPRGTADDVRRAIDEALNRLRLGRDLDIIAEKIEREATAWLKSVIETRQPTVTAAV